MLMGTIKVWESIFQGPEQNFKIGQNPKIWGNFSKNMHEIYKNFKIIEKI